ncbi:MAG: hypothetical protein IT204_20040 [Fimbriimonadaceae bacterium]|nr:hypothetical protein [Fimbriimonadaceae bacterium]
MTLRERFLSTLRRQQPDRVPLMLESFHLPDRSALERPADPCWEQVARRAYDHVPALRHLGSHHNRYLVTPPQRIREVARQETARQSFVTTAIDTPHGVLTAIVGTEQGIRTSWQVKYPCESVAEVEALAAVPWELPPAVCQPREPVEADDRTIRRGQISSPMVCVAGAMPYELFLELCLTAPERVEAWTAQCLARELDLLAWLLAAGDIDLVWLGGCEWITPPMASPAIYERFVQAPEATLIERIHAAGALAHVHCHGRVRDTLPLVIARGADYFEPVEPPPDGDLPFAEAKSLAAGRLTLGGNVEARILEAGTLAETTAAVEAAFEGGGAQMALATSAGPFGPTDARTAANYLRLLDLWEQLSPL